LPFFDTKPYDKDSFNELNKSYNYEITYFRYHLTSDNMVLAQGFDVVVVFVNDIITDAMMSKLAEYGVRLIALRCSGFKQHRSESSTGKD